MCMRRGAQAAHPACAACRRRRGVQAPELFKTGGVHNEKVDVYSFGVILYELITGREPWSHIKVSAQREHEGVGLRARGHGRSVA